MSVPALPLFPLDTVLFPGGPLRLRIFEPRYLDMVRRCLREQSAFGVVLVLHGEEAGLAAERSRHRHQRAAGGFRHAAGRLARHHVPRAGALPHAAGAGSSTTA